MRRQSLLSAGLLSVFLVAGDAAAQDCTKEAFAEVTRETSARIRGMNQEHATAFRAKLDLLRAQNGWSEHEFLVHAGAFVHDETVVGFDAENEMLLAQIGQMSQGGEGTQSNRCAMLSRVREIMDKVVANTAKKWGHMLGKLDDALAGAMQVSAKPME